MKKYFFVATIFATLVFSGCKIDDSIGTSIQPPQDAIQIVVGTFWLSSADFIYDSISAQCNDTLSMLLGEYYSAKYGSTKAELIVQIAPPLDFEFNEAQYSYQPDSVAMILVYNRWFGSNAEPLEVAVYELDKGTPEKYAFYPITFDIDNFTGKNKLLGSKITTSVPQDSATASKETGTHVVRYKFNDEWTNYFFNIAKKKYDKIDDFTNEFKGFYITTTYGQSTMLYLIGIEMRLFYHYTYQKNGKDTIVPSIITFPANKEVRQLNKISHNNTQHLINQRDSVNYIKTCGGIYPKVKIPLGSIRSQMNDSIGNKIPSINSAILSIEATEIDSSKFPIPMLIPSNMLLLPVDEATNFFQNNNLSAFREGKAALAFYNPASNKREYAFDIAYLLSKILIKRNEEDKKKEDYYSETAEFILVPVDVYGSGTAISDIRPQKQLGAVTVRSAKNSYSPMRIELVYSGF